MSLLSLAWTVSAFATPADMDPPSNSNGPSSDKLSRESAASRRPEDRDSTSQSPSIHSPKDPTP